MQGFFAESAVTGGKLADSGWYNVPRAGGVSGVLRVRKKAGMVFLDCVISQTTMFSTSSDTTVSSTNLPAEYRPSTTTQIFGGTYSSAASRMNAIMVTSGGSIVVRGNGAGYNAATGSGVWLTD